MTDEARKFDPLRTALAAKGVELSALFFVVFEHFELPGTPPRQPRLVAPPGPSTGGGKLARQNISLVPVDGAQGPSVVVGWADSSTRRAELRVYRVVADGYRARFGKDLDIPRAAYNRFVAQTEEFLREQGFVIVEVAHAEGGAPARRAPTWTWVLVLLAVLLLGVGIGVGWVLAS